MAIGSIQPAAIDNIEQQLWKILFQSIRNAEGLLPSLRQFLSGLNLEELKALHAHERSFFDIRKLFILFSEIYACSCCTRGPAFFTGLRAMPTLGGSYFVARRPTQGAEYHW
jgi:hypothetical protein